MENTASQPPRTVNVHSASTRVLAVVAWAFCALLAVNLLLTGTGASIWRFLPWLLLAAWMVHVLLWRPCLLVGPDALVVRNILRDTTIPFSELIAVRVLQTTSFDTTAGRITSWGAPGTGRQHPRPSASPAKTRTPALPHTQAAVQSGWDAWADRNPAAAPTARMPAGPPAAPGPRPGHPGKVAVRWNRTAVVVGVLVVLLVLASART